MRALILNYLKWEVLATRRKRLEGSIVMLR